MFMLREEKDMNSTKESYKTNGVSVDKYTPSEASTKPPIVMVHGGEHGSWGWALWADYFCKAGYEVHALNWYNHGDSDTLPESEFIKRSITDVAHKEISYVIDGLSRTPILIGHSMGGLASAAYATNHQLQKLVLVTPVLPKVVGADAIPLPVDATQPFPVLPFAQSKEFFFTTVDEADARSYYAKLVPESSQAVIEATKWTVDLDPQAITTPVLVLGTEFDRLIPNEPLRHYAELLHAKYVHFDGIGHSDILLKDPQWLEAATKVKDWLEEN
jgi:pimeloyl-ACP methyl ester carboxylesterase